MPRKKIADRDPQRVTLMQEHLSSAIDAANEATAAGLDAQEQLEHGIRAYLHSWAVDDPDIETVISYGKE